MTIRQKMTFEAYLALENFEELPLGSCEFIDGELVELAPESRPNVAIAIHLAFLLMQAGIPLNLIYPHTCEVEVPVLKRGDARTRIPDLVVLRPEHLALTQRRLTITADMPPPQLIVEVVSPGKMNRDRDYRDKRNQYQHRGIPEYWLIDPENQSIIVFYLEGEVYVQIGCFQGQEVIQSLMFQSLSMTPEQVFAGGQ